MERVIFHLKSVLNLFFIQNLTYIIAIISKNCRIFAVEKETKSITFKFTIMTHLTFGVLSSLANQLVLNGVVDHFDMSFSTKFDTCDLSLYFDYGDNSYNSVRSFVMKTFPSLGTKVYEFPQAESPFIVLKVFEFNSNE